MSQVIITRCEHLWDINAFDYEAISPLFDQCPDSDILPDYIFFDNVICDLKCQRIKDRFDTAAFVEKTK